MAIDFDFQLVLDLLLAAACGAALGLEREIMRKPAGLRTNMLIALGSALFTYCSLALSSEHGAHGDPARIAAQIVVGIGFIGAGTIMRHNDQVTGLTSAATVWVVAAIGILAGANRPIMAVCGTAIALTILNVLGRLEGFIVARIVDCRIEIAARERDGILTDTHALFRRQQIQVQTLDHKILPDGRMEITVHYHTTRRRHAGLEQHLLALDAVEGVKSRIL